MLQPHEAPWRIGEAPGAVMPARWELE